MLFALFFGAGNLIFPAAMGQSAGSSVWWAILGFCVTGVGLPLLAVAAIGYSGCRDLQEAAGRVHPWYGLAYSVICYLSIGPCFAIPRTGTVSYEIAVKPFLGDAAPEWAMPLFLLGFFAVSLWFAISPSKLVDRIGKVLTPALLAVIAVLVVKSVATPMGVPEAASDAYATPLVAVVQGVLDGYNTLDAIAAVIFASLVVNIIKDSGVTDTSEIAKTVYKAGAAAVAALAVVYIFIAKIGAESVAAIGMQDTGAPVLAKSAMVLFGNAGAGLLSVIVLLACVSTAIGLITCCAAYFMERFGHFSYRTYAVAFTVISYLIALFGLKTIIVATVPVLMFIYPLVVALIALLFLNNFFGGRQCVYAWTMGCTLIMAFINLFETAGVQLGALEEFLKAYVPLHTYGLGWLGFAVVGFVIGLVWKAACPAKVAAS